MRPDSVRPPELSAVNSLSFLLLTLASRVAVWACCCNVYIGAKLRDTPLQRTQVGPTTLRASAGRGAGRSAFKPTRTKEAEAAGAAMQRAAAFWPVVACSACVRRLSKNKAGIFT